MLIKITRPGIFTTIQDLGRPGFRALGIGPGGAMDGFAAAAANYLVGNEPQDPVIEMHFPAPEIFFESEALASITGANFTPVLDGQPVETWKPVLVKKNSTLLFDRHKSGARAYLATNPCIMPGNWLNSFSTNTRVKAGGHGGRALQKSDIIAVQDKEHPIPRADFLELTEMDTRIYGDRKLRCIAGPEWHLLDEASGSRFQEASYMITTQSDRMGYRLKGANLALRDPVEMVSSPVDCGTIQLLPGGQLIILMADHQTTGGYPRIASVISADLPKLAQSAIADPLLFELTDLDTAEELLFSMYRELELIKNTCAVFYGKHRH